MSCVWLTTVIQGAAPSDWRSDFFYEHAIIQSKNFIPSSQALVTGRMKYILWSDFQVEELFDIQADPHEEDNLIADPAHVGDGARHIQTPIGRSPAGP